MTEVELKEWYEKKTRAIIESDAPNCSLLAGCKNDQLKALQSEYAVRLAVILAKEMVKSKIKSWL